MDFHFDIECYKLEGIAQTCPPGPRRSTRGGSMTVTHQPTAALSEDPAAGPVPVSASPPDDTALVEEDLLVEDVSIDGMCGVY
jgi:mycofactocin precursor